MAHDPKHLRLVNAIIDGEVEGAEIAQRAQSLGGSLAERLNRITRAIVTMRVAGRISPAQAKVAYVEAFKALSLGGFARVAEATQLHGAKTAVMVHTEAKALGLEALTMKKITREDFKNRALARELEREHKGADNGL